MNNGFADRSLTTWAWRRSGNILPQNKIHVYSLAWIILRNLVFYDKSRYTV